MKFRLNFEPLELRENPIGPQPYPPIQPVLEPPPGYKPPPIPSTPPAPPSTPPSTPSTPSTPPSAPSGGN